ncbi:MAG: tagatose-bisphosphate aldolase [Aerococcus suis]|nr:tagatose-bisphosphate aldolase [Aerococcus suis]
MLHLSENKKAALKQLSNEDDVIAALAIDQRGALRRMLDGFGADTDQETIEEFKSLVSKELTKYASSILLDPEYGLPATKVRDDSAGLLLAYEKTGYDADPPGRLPDLLNVWSAKRIKEAGADAVKILVYYDVDEGDEINDQKKAFVERVGSEAAAEDIPFFLELVSYDANIEDAKSAEFAKVKPHKVNEMMKVFSDPRYQVDVLKMEVPVNMNFVEGYGDGEVVYTQEEAKQAFKEQAEATNLPYIFLSAGVSMDLFKDTLKFAKEAGSTFNGVLCGRSTWKNSVEVYATAEGDREETTLEWLRTEGKANIEALNAVLKETATPWNKKID